MASRFYPCICGKFATIHMFRWLDGDHVVECLCGRELKVGSLVGAKYAWLEYMKREKRRKEAS